MIKPPWKKQVYLTRGKPHGRRLPDRRSVVITSIVCARFRSSRTKEGGVVGRLGTWKAYKYTHMTSFDSRSTTQPLQRSCLAIQPKPQEPRHQ